MADFALEIREILNAQEMRGEKLVNHFRLGYSVLGLGLLASAWEINRPAASVAFLVQGLAWAVYALVLYGLLRWLRGRYVPWLKYVTITLDLLLCASTAIPTALNNSGILEYFLSFMALLGVFWNIASGFRLSLAAGIYSAILTMALNLGILLFAVQTGLVGTSPTSVYGVPLINVSDQVNAIFFIAMPGVMAAVMARIARGLVQRAEEESLKRARMEKERDRLGRYLSKNLVDLVLANPDKLELGGARRVATIMFTDIRNFTPYSETREPEEVVRFLNDYFTQMHEIVFRYGGTLDKYLGDGLMAEFGVPFPGFRAPLRAVIAALEMVYVVHRMNERARMPGQPAVDIGAGISTGPVVAGDIGSLDRMEYTCIGDTVNFAARLEGMNRSLSSSIAICESTYQALPPDLLPAEKHEGVAVKGKREPVVLYTIQVPDDIPALLEVLKKELDRVEANDRILSA